MPSPRSTIDFVQSAIDRRTINGDLRGSRNKTMLTLIGNPRGTYDTECRGPTNSRIAAMMVTDDFGPFRATGLKPAVQTLQKIMARIKRDHREIHDVMSTAGMLCCRLVRRSTTAISNHSWGTAIDILLEGKLDARGDGRTQIGLIEIYKAFNAEGFFWGAAFTTEDSMHFEASEQLVQTWASEGLFGELPPNAEQDFLDIGDRGPQVEDLQNALNLMLALDLDVDGIFGKDTRAAVMEFQRSSQLTVDGIVGPKTEAALKRAQA